ncbi:MAG: serine/threonine-protein phosphatase [Cyclobacteriaceae bacterium]|nr:serine/threonine-protein phosphatase [Cyclobacteriaceae bacterium]
MKFIKYTNTGSRKLNEDSLYVSELNNVVYAAVADGVGGLNHGDFASNFVITRFEKFCKENVTPDLNQFLINTNDSLIEIAKNHFNDDKIATTFTGGVITEKLIMGIHIGDSRACVLRGNGIKQLTIDQTELGRLIREGEININERKFYSRRNIIENVLGRPDMFEPQNFNFNLESGDRIIFSTDGFHEVISKLEIRDISIKFKSLDELGRKLIIELENRILHDNATFICIEI